MPPADSDTLANILIAEWQAGKAQLDLDLEVSYSTSAAPGSASSAPRAGPLAAGKDPLPDHDASLPLVCGVTIRCPHTGLAVTTPFHPASWLQLLRNHPDAAWAHRLVHDLVHGVDIGYRRQRSLHARSRNFVESAEEEAAVDADLTAEVALGHVAGPYDAPPFPFYRCSPLKTVPKKGSVARFRIIHHLSHPHGRSINSSTADWPCVLVGFSTAVRMVRKLGRGCYLAKLDVKAAYRCMPVRPADWPLLGMHWKGRYLFHKTLPFGLRSSCHLWERYATALEWVIRAVFAVQNITHYVDDTCIGNVTLSGCTRDLAQATAAMDELGVPVAQDKTEGPTTSLVYLGIRIDTVEMSISFDRTRVLSILAIVADLEGRRTCSLRRLQSTLGTLQWAAQVVRHGRTFLQHLRDVSVEHGDTSRPHDEGAIPVSDEARGDLRWWQDHLAQWNGVSLLWEEEWLDRTSILQPHTDACVGGYAGVCGTEWFHGQWSSQQEQLSRDGGLARDSMPWKELFAIVAAASTWGHRWERKKVIFVTDCMPVVQALSKGASRTKRIMQLIRHLHHCAALHHFVYRAEHIAGVDNVIADELPRVFDVSQLSASCRRSIDHSPVIPVLPVIPS